jgi:uncharacterized protein (TIGR03067 family)
MARRILLLVVSVALVGFAPAPFPKERRGRGGPADVRGLWQIVGRELNGAAYLNNNVYDAEVSADRWAFVGKNGGKNGTAYELRLVPTAVPPAFTWGRENRVQWVGSYRLRGDELTLIFTGGSGLEQRPTDFAGKPQWRYELKRLRRE